MAAMRSTEPEILERDLDAVAKFVFHQGGAQGDGYYSLIASASNAYFPHYNAGKRVMQDGQGADIRVAHHMEQSAFGLAFASDEHREGMGAFLEKRDPKFS